MQGIKPWSFIPFVSFLPVISALTFFTNGDEGDARDKTLVFHPLHLVYPCDFCSSKGRANSVLTCVHVGRAERAR
jgi:hypothetical protein